VKTIYVIMYEDPYGRLEDRPKRGVCSASFEDMDEALVQAHDLGEKVNHEVYYWVAPITLYEQEQV